MSLRFEWNTEKAKQNLDKHNISFEEAQTVFLDPLAAIMSDPDHSETEQRYIELGASARGRVLIVAYTERGSAIRIISARRATRFERETYEERRP